MPKLTDITADAVVKHQAKRLNQVFTGTATDEATLELRVNTAVQKHYDPMIPRNQVKVGEARVGRCNDCGKPVSSEHRYCPWCARWQVW